MKSKWKRTCTANRMMFHQSCKQISELRFKFQVPKKWPLLLVPPLAKPAPLKINLSVSRHRAEVRNGGMAVRESQVKRSSWIISDLPQLDQIQMCSVVDAGFGRVIQRQPVRCPCKSRVRVFRGADGNGGLEKPVIDLQTNQLEKSLAPEFVGSDQIYHVAKL